MPEETFTLKENLASISEVFEFLSDGKTNTYTMGQYSKDWKKLSEQDRIDIRRGVGNGTLTY